MSAGARGWRSSRLYSPERWAPRSRDAMPVMSREHLQQVERKETHKHREHTDTPQVLYTHAPLLSQGNTGPSHPGYITRMYGCCSFIHVDALKTNTKERSKVIRGELTRKYNFQWLFSLFLAEIILSHEGQSTPSLIYHRQETLTGLWQEATQAAVLKIALGRAVEV